MKEEWIESFVRDGYFHFRGLVDERDVSAARQKIDSDLEINYDPTREKEYGARTYCPGIVGSTEIMALLKQPELERRIEALVKRKKLAETQTGQIALRRAHNVDRVYPPEPHVDGYPTADNGVKGHEVVPFTMLVAVFLSEVGSEFAGNFTVWPGSHTVVEEYFKRTGPDARRLPFPKLEIGQAKQLCGSAGDVVICHYQLAHTAAVNLSEFNRYAVFFRLAHRELVDYEGPSYRADVWKHLSRIWSEWRVSG